MAKQTEPKEATLVTWNDEQGMQKALASVDNMILNSRSVYRNPVHSQSAYQQYSFRDIVPNANARLGFTQKDYEFFRPDEALPTRPKDILSACNAAYWQVGLIRNIIDLMGDFTVQGIKIVHPNPTINKYCQVWWKKVQGKLFSERFANTLYRLGMVIVRRYTAKLTKSQDRKFQKIQGEADFDYQRLDLPSRNEIALKYSIFSPMSVDIVNGSSAIHNFAGQYQLAISIPQSLKNNLLNPNSAAEKEAIGLLPPEVLKAITTGQPVTLPKDKTEVYFYKKDDWELWPKPIIYSILEDIILYRKMKMADKVALDGVISNIRVWKLGDLDKKIVPGEGVVAKLIDMLTNNVAGGVMDIVWGPAIELLETKAQYTEILGSAKYGPVLSAIYTGLGIPPSLTGSTSSGLTSDAIGLKTLIERLKYGRNVITQFWDKELALLQQAKGWRIAPTIHFDQTVLSDEMAWYGLIIKLVEMNILSYETVRERFGEIPELEDYRTRNESKRRESGKMPEQASPYHNPNFENEVRKMAFSLGVVGLDEIGVKLQPAGPNNKKYKPPVKTAPGSGKTPSLDGKGRPGQGRPPLSKDKQKRKQKRVVPRIKSDLLIWASRAYKDIAEEMAPVFLDIFKVKNLRQMTTAQAAEAEKIKFSIFANLNPFQTIKEHDLPSYFMSLVEENKLAIPKNIVASYNDMVRQLNDKVERQPTLDELRQLQVLAFVQENHEDGV